MPADRLPSPAEPQEILALRLSLFFLTKPYDILRDSVGDLVDANPYAETINAVEEWARAVADRFRPAGVPPPDGRGPPAGHPVARAKLVCGAKNMRLECLRSPPVPRDASVP